MKITQNKKSPDAEKSRMYCHISDTRYILKEHKGSVYSAGFICKNCINHKQLDTDIADDCKVEIYDMDENGKIVIIGQCCCYSKEHGLRGDKE